MSRPTIVVVMPPLIIGGGPAGAAAAITLARAGHAATLFERQAAPADKVCGDFLTGEALTDLAAFGLDLAALAPAPIRRLRLIHRRSAAEVSLPFMACGLSRRALDAALLRLADAAGTTLRLGRAISSLQRSGGGWIAAAGEAAAIESASVFLATGKHELHGHRRHHPRAGTVGLKQYYSLAPAQRAELADAVELMLFPGGYAGLQPIEGNQVVLCLMLPTDRLRAAGSPEALLAALRQTESHLERRLQGAEPLRPKVMAVAEIPYGYRCAPDPAAPALFRVGDQASVIPSLTGDGIALALRSGRLAAEYWLRHGGDADGWHAEWRHHLRGQMRRAMALQAVAVQPALQPFLPALGRWLPGVLRLAARSTRLAD